MKFWTWRAYLGLQYYHAELLLLLDPYCILLVQITNTITVGVVGLPNVGKSSLINSLKRCHVVDVSATPGLTKSMQEVELDKNIKLLDCPGVVMVKSEENEASIALRNCIKIDKVDDPTSPGNILYLSQNLILQAHWWLVDMFN